MKINGTSAILSKEISKNSPNAMTSMGNKKALLKKSTCSGLNDPCIINGTVKKRLNELISK